MVSEQDKRIYFLCSFNEQMAWIDEEVELILQCEKRTRKRNPNAEIVKINRNEDSGHTIARLFKIIKEDPKNVAVLREVETAERELWDFLEQGVGAKSEEEIYAYWHNYLLAYIAELESSPVHYFLICGYDEFHDGDEWIGIYDSLTQLKSAYEDAVQELEQEHRQYRENSWTVGHEKVMVNVFDESTGKWHYDIPYAVLFPNKNDCSSRNIKW